MPTTMFHTCPADGCMKDVRNDMLMCPRHWGMVPKPLQNAVYRAWRNGDGEGSPAHAQAIHAAIDAVDRKLAG